MRSLLAGIALITMTGTAQAGFLSDLMESNCQTAACIKNAENLRSLGHSMRDAAKAVRPPAPPPASMTCRRQVDGSVICQ